MLIMGGLGFLYLSNEKEIQKTPIVYKPLKTESLQSNDLIDTTTQSPIIREVSTKSNTSFASENTTEPNIQNSATESLPPPKMEDVLASMTEKELIDLASKYEQDPYLELY